MMTSRDVGLSIHAKNILNRSAGKFCSSHQFPCVTRKYYLKSNQNLFSWVGSVERPTLLRLRKIPIMPKMSNTPIIY